jgi:phosphopantothenate---cysteine ligase (CTP)
MKLLITSGGTKIPIDKVRHISNMSSGTFGSKIAFEALKNGHEIRFLRAKESKSPFSEVFDMNKRDEMPFLPGRFEKWYNERFSYLKNYTENEYSTFDDYVESLSFDLLDFKPDVVVLAAAVSDYGVENFQDGKIRSGDGMTIKLTPLPKIISQIKEQHPNVKLVGFKLLVNSTDLELIQAAQSSVEKNGCDMVVANDLRDIKNDNHRVFIVKKQYTGILPYLHRTDLKDKNYLAKRVVEAIESL